MLRAFVARNSLLCVIIIHCGCTQLQFWFLFTVYSMTFLVQHRLPAPAMPNTKRHAYTGAPRLYSRHIQHLMVLTQIPLHRDDPHLCVTRCGAQHVTPGMRAPLQDALPAPGDNVHVPKLACVQCPF